MSSPPELLEFVKAAVPLLDRIGADILIVGDNVAAGLRSWGWPSVSMH